VGRQVSRRRNLVIVRAGDTSLHEQWLAGDGERNWDLIVSYFGDDPDRFRKVDVQRIDSKGQKWPALHNLIQRNGPDVFCYDHVWFPDDDLSATKVGINLLFDIVDKYGLALAQPALTLDSYHTYLITLYNKSFFLHFTNFVEIMAPCFNRDFLKQMFKSFNENQSGWGLDLLWPTRISDWSRIAIIDAVTVCHTRPLFSGPSYHHLAHAGKDPKQEFKELLIKFGITPHQPFVRGAIDNSGRRLSMYDSTARELIESIVFGYLPRAQLAMNLVRPNLDQLGRSAFTAAPAVPPK
jgi:hypothetical protein